VTFSVAASAVTYKDHSDLSRLMSEFTKEIKIMSIECFEVSFNKELCGLLIRVDQEIRDESLNQDSIYHDRITNILL